MLKRLSMFLFVFVLASSVVVPAAAAGTAQTDPGTGGPVGVVPPYGQQNAANALGGGQLLYHGGAVMHINKVYTVFWIPSGYSVAAGYPGAMNQFFKDVAADSGMSSNIYWSDTQYYGPGAVNILYQSTFGGGFMDTHPFPPSACALKPGLTHCVSDAQIRTELHRVIALKHWVINGTTEFYLFTPNHVRSCDVATDCSFTQYCAYHWWDGKMIYANMPYASAKPGCSILNGTSTPPNSVAVDSTISVLSHEHNESITDPYGKGWWDNKGYENGDKCAWLFAPLVGGSYNETINGHHYITQMEWSNATASCVQSGL